MTSITDKLGAKRQYITSKYRYFVTIRKSQVLDYVTKLDLLQVIWAIKLHLMDLRVLHYTYETNGEYNQLHWHGICTTKDPVYYKRNSRAGDFRVYWEPTKVTDYDKLWDYVNKQHNNRKELQQQIFQINQYNHIYYPPGGGRTEQREGEAQASKSPDNKESSAT